MVKQILNAKLTTRSPAELKSFCNEAWAKYSGGTSTPVSDSTTASYGLYMLPEGQRAENGSPMLYCKNETIDGFNFFISTMYDNESATDIHFIFWSENNFDYYVRGYLYV